MLKQDGLLKIDENKKNENNLSIKQFSSFKNEGKPVSSQIFRLPQLQLDKKVTF